MWWNANTVSLAHPFIRAQVVERISNATATACSGPNEHAIGMSTAAHVVLLYQSGNEVMLVWE